MFDILTIAVHISPWTLAAYFGGAFIGMALQAWRDRCHV